MCGIAGIFNPYQAKQIHESDIINMSASLAHRGPDGYGVYLSDEISLGHTRLSIIDLAGGHQPMMTDRYVISYNGEVYNYIELRETLKKKGYYCHTASDTEVVLKAFEYYGVDALSHFNGQFAILLWDRKERRLLAARDRYGVRPLYVLHHDHVYYFSSELKAFDTIDGYTRTFNMENLFEHALLWNTLEGRTVFNKIRSIAPGTYEIYTNDRGPVTTRYYELGESEDSSSNSIEQAIEEFLYLMHDSVNLRLRSDVPVADYLSGGIDSSVITHLTSQIVKDKFKTFSVAFEDSDFDESKYQKEMVKRLHSDHHELKITYSMIDETFQDVIYHIETPIFRTAPVPLYILSEKVRKEGIKVVLTGEAADEILWGYDSFKELKLLEFWKRNSSSQMRPQLIKRLYPHLRYYKNRANYGLMRMYYEGFLNEYDNDLAGLNIRVSNNAILRNYFNKDYNISFNKEKFLENVKKILPSNFNSWTLLQKNQFLEMKTLLSGYLLSSQGDRMSLAHGVEGRYPFLDHRIVERLFYHNDNYKLNGFSQKYLLRKAFRNIIPDSIIDRPKLPYMAPDLKSFFKNGALTERASFFLSPELIKNYGIFNDRFVCRFLNKYKNGLPDTVGYRDNMIITFIISSQIIYYNIRNNNNSNIDNALQQNVRIVDYKK